MLNTHKPLGTLSMAQGFENQPVPNRRSLRLNSNLAKFVTTRSILERVQPSLNRPVRSRRSPFGHKVVSAGVT